MDAQDQNNYEDFKSTEPQEFTAALDTLPLGLDLPPEPPPDKVSDPEQDRNFRESQPKPNDAELASEEKLQISEVERRTSEEKLQISEVERRTSEVEPEINDGLAEVTEEIEQPLPAYSKIIDDDFTTVELDGKFLVFVLFCLF